MAWSGRPVLPGGARLTATAVDAILDQIEGLSGGTQQAVCSAALTLSTTPTDITGCSVAVTATQANAYAMVQADIDFEKDAAAAACVGYLNIDGANHTTQVIGGPTGATAWRGTVGQTWRVPLAVGAHTLKLQGAKSAAAGTMLANQTHTQITVTLYDIP